MNPCGRAMNEHTLFSILLYTWLGLSVLVPGVLLVISAPYGRHARKGWGPTLSSTAGWVLMEAPAALAIAAFYLLSPRPPGAVQWLFLGIWECHYLNRAFIYPLRLSGRGSRVPLTVVLMGACFNVVNGYLNGRWLTALAPAYPPAWLADPRFLAGTMLFFAGLYLNLDSDRRLRLLRRPGETGYKVPSGGGFRWVSCPNYLGEMVEWCGWALLTWSLPGLAFAAWTTANLLPRALTHHRWYLREFPDYPRQRRAVLPYLL